MVARALPLFPPVVTGSIIAIIGISLMKVTVNWAAGGQPMIKDVVSGQMVNNPSYGSLDNLAIAGLVLLTIMLITRYGRGFLSNVGVLLGMLTVSYTHLNPVASKALKARAPKK